MPFRRHAQEEDGNRGSSDAGLRKLKVRKRKGAWAQEQLPLQIDNSRSVGFAENIPAVFKSDASFYSNFSKFNVPVFPAQLLDRSSIALLAS